MTKNEKFCKIVVSDFTQCWQKNKSTIFFQINQQKFTQSKAFQISDNSQPIFCTQKKSIVLIQFNANLFVHIMYISQTF